MLTHKGYTGQIEFDDEARVFHGEVLDTRDVITFEGSSLEELFRAFQDSIEDYLEFRQQQEEGQTAGSALTRAPSMEDNNSMITTVTQKNMVTIPAEVGRKLGIKPGWKLDWQPIEGKEEILVRVIPNRGELARRLVGLGRKYSPDRDSVAELVAEREAEG